MIAATKTRRERNYAAARSAVSVKATDLFPGMRVVDDFNEWSEVLSMRPIYDDEDRNVASVKVTWFLPNGKTEHAVYSPDTEFTPIHGD